MALTEYVTLVKVRDKDGRPAPFDTLQVGTSSGPLAVVTYDQKKEEYTLQYKLKRPLDFITLELTDSTGKQTEQIKPGKPQHIFTSALMAGPKPPNSRVTNATTTANPLMEILREAIRAVPAVRYALGIVGIVSAIAIIFSFGVDPKVALFGVVVMVVLMVLLVVFARLVSSTPGILHYPALVLVWSFLLLSIATAGCLFSSVFFRTPVDLQYLLGSSPSQSKSGSAKAP